MADKNERKEAMIKRIQEYIIIQGFEQLKMEDIYKIMGVSRAKLYQYFASKEDIVASVVARYVDYIKSVAVPYELAEDSAFIAEFPNFFYQNVALWGMTTDLFLEQLKTNYPDLYLEIQELLDYRRQQMERFYDIGRVRGIFYLHLNGKLLIIQDQTLIPRITKPAYLLEYGLTIEQALLDYYHMLVTMLFVPERQAEVQAIDISSWISPLSAKFKRIF